MRHRVWVLVVLSAVSLAAGCVRRDETAMAPPTHLPRLADTPEPTATLASGTVDSTPVCPPAGGEGTVSPAVSIYSITFVVNGVEQVVRDGDTLQALPGEEMEVREVTICTGPFSGNGGEACVDVAPVDQSGHEIMSGHGGTHMARVTAGFVSIPGPSKTWTIDEGWKQISAVLNHWPPQDTGDLECGNGRCEHDDWAVVGFR